MTNTDLAWEEHGSGEALLWLHGFTGVGADWRYVFDGPAAGYRLIAPDLPGHGGSIGHPGPYSFRQAAGSVLALLDRIGLDRVAVIGLSGGGIVGLHLATAAPSRVTRLIAISAPPAFPEPARRLQRAFTLDALSESERERLRRVHPHAGQVDTLVAQTRTMADAGDPSFTPDDLARITADTLIVFGDRDPLYPVSIACELRGAIRRSWLWVVPNGGHGPVFGPFAAAFRETALHFLNGDWARG